MVHSFTVSWLWSVYMLSNVSYAGGYCRRNIGCGQLQCDADLISDLVLGTLTGESSSSTTTTCCEGELKKKSSRVERMAARALQIGNNSALYTTVLAQQTDYEKYHIIHVIQ